MTTVVGLYRQSLWEILLKFLKKEIDLQKRGNRIALEIEFCNYSQIVLFIILLLVFNISMNYNLELNGVIKNW